ncbi:MAG: glycosyltransferase family 2 protein [Rhodospirillaceae bacterium]|nr:glycosyltransferase family 2 protein [Rhodospirillaceae bacterium]
MNDPGMPPAGFALTDTARATALSALAACAESGAPLPAPVAPILEAWCAEWTSRPAAAGLVARPCPLPAPLWHLRKMSEHAAERVRAAFHARMLGHLLAPQVDALRPAVTILIPVFNRAAMVIEAVESCLAQDWRPLEVLVVDDGSTDDPAAALRNFGSTVRVQRQSNGGVASARNAGIAAARGDFIHFLDSDNLLEPDAISAKLAAFRVVADAELCFARHVTVLPDGSAVAGPPPAGNQDCPTTDLLRATVLRYPFLMSSAMLPRWVVLAADRFDTDLPRTEDFRYWFRLALRGAKAVAVDKPLLVRRRPPDSLHSRRRADSGPDIAMALRSAVDLMQHPQFWAYVRTMLKRARRNQDRPIAGTSSALVEKDVATFRRHVARICAEAPSGDPTPLPLLAILRHELGRSVRSAGPSAPLSRLAEDLEPLLTRATATAPGLAPADIRYWLAQSGAVAKRENLCAIISALARGIDGEDELCRATALVLRLPPRQLKRSAALRHLRMRHRLGSALATAYLRARIWLHDRLG